MDVLRRRFQVSNLKAPTEDRYSGIADAVRQILAKEGIRGFYKGLLPNLLKVAPSMATSWFTFEFVKDFCLAM
jgi:solute carrier family 25 (mitochondrial phosphate transporter), member 23/24/25/41